MNYIRRSLLAGLFFCVLLCRSAFGGGSGLNVVVVVNQASTNSLQLGNYYCEKRHIPPQNVLRINWTGTNTIWSFVDYSNTLFMPFQSMLAARQLTNQVDYVVLSMDIPYRIKSTASIWDNSTTSALFYGYKADPNPAPLQCSMAPDSTNAYAGSESPWPPALALPGLTNSCLVMMITSSNLALAQQIIDGGVAADFTFPTQTVYLVKGSDPDRNVRYLSFDDAIFNTRLRGNYHMVRTNVYLGLPNIFGYQFGAYSLNPTGYAFLPGSMVDNLTSWGGILFQDGGGQLNILELLNLGATATYGTVEEPCNYLEKFPSPQDYFYQARGFNVAECYYQSVTNPYEGVFVGEPLAAPFAQPAQAAWLGLPANALLSGATNLSVRFDSGDTSRPIQQLDLFVDGLWRQTITNIAPGQSNVLSVNINGGSTNFVVGSPATIASVTASLTEALNSVSNSSKVAAFAHGDRVELRAMDRTKLGASMPLSVSASPGGGAGLTTFLHASDASLLDSSALGRRNLVIETSTNYPPPVGSYLLITVTKTNGNVVTVGVTNSLAGMPLADLVSNLVTAINLSPALAGPDGCHAEDFIDYSIYWDPSDHGAEFNLLANSPGWNPAQILTRLEGTNSVFTINARGTWPLQDNETDLQPRAHLYVSAGVTNLAMTFPLDTTTLPDGDHVLAVVAYEGTHVRTQTQLAQNVRIQNSALSASLTLLSGASNTLVGLPLMFSVQANTNSVSHLELFSTGGLLGSATNQSSATFTLASASLGVGLHPVYAVITRNDGHQFRTGTTWIRLLAPGTPESRSQTTLSSPPPVLSWTATAGRSYDILSATNPAAAFQLSASVTPTNSPAHWVDTNPPAPARFYRLRTSN